MPVTLIKVFKAPGSDQVIEKKCEVEFYPVQYDIRSVEPDVCKLYVGVPWNADLIGKDITESFSDDDELHATLICSPRGCDLNDPEAVFSHMDKMFDLPATLGGFHEAGRPDYNIYHLINMGNRLAAGNANISVDAYVMNPGTGKLEQQSVSVPNLPGFITILSANPLWSRCLSWLPQYSLSGTQYMTFVSMLLGSIVDPRWFVNPNNGKHTDTTLIRQFFGAKLCDIINHPNSNIVKRHMIALGSWNLEDKYVTDSKEPNYYFIRLRNRIAEQLKARYPAEVANNIAMFKTTIKFVEFIWLVWMQILCNEIPFDSMRFFKEEAASRSFDEYFTDH